MQKLLLSIIALFMLLSASVNAETISQRLDKIEKRLEKIDESLDGSKLLQGLIGEKTELNSDSTPPVTKLGFILYSLSCSNDTLLEQIKISYLITNNYEQEVKLVDAYFVAKDLFGDEVFKAKIVKGVYLKPGKSENIKATVSGGLLNDNCAKVKQARVPDLTVELHVSKIAFGDNSVVVFNGDSNDKSSLDKKNIGAQDSYEDRLAIQNKINDMFFKYMYECWSIPLGLPDNEDLSFSLELELNPDGKIKKASYSNEDINRMNRPGQGYFKVLAESGMRAARLCEPFEFPPDKYAYWKKLKLNFNANN